VSNSCVIRVGREHFAALQGCLFPGDHDEHGAVLLAGVSRREDRLTLHVREVHPTVDGVDYVAGQFGYRALHPKFIHRMITRARDESLAYLAVHNHGSDRNVRFSHIDMESHERGYPALLQISRGLPIGALVFGHRSAQADVWTSADTRLDLEELIVIGNTVQRLTPAPRSFAEDIEPIFDRQVRLFGAAGQQELARCRVAILGLGGVGSLLAEYLSRLGVGQFELVDPDIVEHSNISRIVGSSIEDAERRIPKVEVARRVILQANPDAVTHLIQDDIAKDSVAKQLAGVDYLFLAADSMRARLVFNAIVHQYLIPGVQLGSKIRSDGNGVVIDVASANRTVRPGHGCLWCNQFIDSTQLAKEAKTDFERSDQAYGSDEPNPSVISLNAISAAHAVTDFMLDYLDIRPEAEAVTYEEFSLLKRSRRLVHPRRDIDCSECSQRGLRYGRADSVPLPTIEG
jgi:hypothetical protein